MAPLRIVHIVSSLSHGGAERQALNLAREARRRGEEAWIVALSGDIPDWPGYESVLKDRALQLHLRLRTAPRDVLRLRRWLKGIRPDVVQTHLVGAGIFGRLAAWLAGVPVVIATEHGRTDWKGHGLRAWERFAQRHTAMRIAVSTEIARLRQEREGTPPDRILVIPNGVAVPATDQTAADRQRFRARWGIPADARLAGFVGRWIEVKNVPAIVQSFAAIADGHPDFWLVVVGEGESRQAIEAARAQAVAGAGDAGRRIHLAGFEAEADRAMAALDVFVMFSTREGLPLSLLEAMAAGVPAIASAVGEIPLALKDGGGIVAPAGDLPALQEALALVLGDVEFAAGLGRDARQVIIDRYSIATSFDQHDELYRRLTAASRRSTTVKGELPG